jgi:hypothetical protein
MYVGLWTRLEDFRREDLTRALEERTVVQATLMRLTIHLVSREDYWPFALGTREARREAWLRARRGEFTAADMEAGARAVRQRLAAGPAHRKEIEAIVGKAMAPGVGQWIDMVRAPPSGTWERRRADLYAAAEDWIGPPDCGAQEGVELLVRRYLGAFGPAPPADIANWAGLKSRALAPALERLDLRRLRGPAGEELLDIPDAPLPRPDTPAPVRLIAHWDAALLVHARRAGILPEEHRPRIFHVHNPHSTAVFLVDGAVAGAWREQDGRIGLEPYEPLDRSTRSALDAEAGRLAGLYG